jgi:hypothetical protein
VDNKNMKQLLQEIKEWEHGYLKYIRYSHKLTTWLYLARWRRLVAFFKKHFDIFLRFSFLALGLGVGILLNFFGGTAFTQEILSNYLVAVGAMSGGAIAIVFTISIFLLQSAADLYSSQYLEVYIHDWKEKVIYLLVIIITILFFGAGLYVGGLPALSTKVSSYIVLVSLVSVGAVFALIDWQYKTVRQKISPTKTIEFLEKRALEFLNQVESDANKIADLMVARDGSLSQNEALAKTYNHVLQPYITNLSRQLENLVEISLKLADKNEVETPKRGFTAVHNILGRFIEVRKTSSVIIPSGIAFMAVESDSQRFFFNNFDRLNKAGEKFIKEGKDENATFFLWLYDSLAIKAKDILYIGRSGENPILENIVGCLESYIDIGIRAKNLEVVFQSIEKLGNIAQIASETGQSPMLKGIQDKLKNIAIYGITEKQTIIVDQCNLTLMRTIGSVFASKEVVRKHHYNDALKHIATIARFVFVARQSGYLSNDFSSSFMMTKAYNEMHMLLAGILNHYGTLTDDREKNRYRSDISDFFHYFYSSLRGLSEDLKNCDSLLVESIGRLLFHVNEIMIQLIEDKEFADEKANLLNWLSWNIHLPSWFAHHAEKFDAGSNNFRSLTECVTKTGILVIERLGDRNLTKSAVDCLGYLTEHALNKNVDRYGYDEPRILEKACYLGVLTLKKGWRDIFADVVIKILDFEPKYAKKYFSDLPAHIDPEKISPRKDQLYLELMKWRVDFDYERHNGDFGIRDDAEAMMYSLISVTDIDWFIYRVWHKWDARSPINDEIEKEIGAHNRKIALQKLVKTLSLIAQK